MAMIRRYGMAKSFNYKPTKNAPLNGEKEAEQREQAQLMVDLLVKRTYWHRVWIVQEIILGKTIHIHCGSEAVPWDAIHCFIDPRLDLIPPNFIEALSNSRAAYLYRNRFISIGRGERSGLTIARWLTVLQGSTCTVPRDVVYGVLAIASDGVKITVDYEKSDWEVYLEIMKVYKNEENLFILMSLLQRSFPLDSLMMPKCSSGQGRECTKIGGIMFKPDLYTKKKAWDATPEPLFDKYFSLRTAKGQLEVNADFLKNLDWNGIESINEEEKMSLLVAFGMSVLGIVPGVDGALSLPGNTTHDDYICSFDKCDRVLGLRRKTLCVSGWELTGVGRFHRRGLYLNQLKYLCELKVEVSMGYPLLQRLTAPL